MPIVFDYINGVLTVSLEGAAGAAFNENDILVSDTDGDVISNNEGNVLLKG